ncbi:sensor histidine kinase [Sphingomonas sp. CFBP 13720]|uniref:sensor histidine kinase n=1 Tax=Sphingomonas sp. CFBP 13720 TaxID=2775302 RepID=UPI001781A16D|nr:sensor histidine kinase [Sphingomonas sp. CFBP 13720]MBD8678532.1 sensor histidine kinase [Sphingomonas sp. CFBP 13720]
MESISVPATVIARHAAGIVAVDADGIAIASSGPIERYLGPVPDVIGRRIEQTIDPALRGAIARLLDGTATIVHDLVLAAGTRTVSIALEPGEGDAAALLIFRDEFASPDFRPDASDISQHRVRNILSVVRSVFRRTAETSDGDELAAGFTGRLDALARTHAMLLRGTDDTVDLAELVAGELLIDGGPDGVRIQMDGPPVRLRANAAQAFGLLVHELTINAITWGALGTTRGTLHIDWALEEADGEQQLRWRWRERGVAVVDTAPSRSGFGRELVERALPYELNARTELVFAPGGLTCIMRVPLIHIIVLKS